MAYRLGAPQRPDVHPRQIPLAVPAAIVLQWAAVLWINAFESPDGNGLSIEYGTFGGFLFVVAVTVGTLLGVRIALYFFFFFGLAMLVMSTVAIGSSDVQGIGGVILSAASLVPIFLPSVQRYESNRLGIVRDGVQVQYQPTTRWLLAAVAVVLFIGWVALSTDPLH